MKSPPGASFAHLRKSPGKDNASYNVVVKPQTVRPIVLPLNKKPNS